MKNILTKERAAEFIEQIKEVNTENYYTDDAINLLGNIIADLYNEDYLDLFDLYEDFWTEDIITQYIKEDITDLDSMIYLLEDCHAGAQYYYRDAYGNFRDVKSSDLEMMADCMIEEIKAATE